MIAIAKRCERKLLQRLASMMDQQFWRWGCDVKHESGNLLVEYGFRRVPPADHHSPCSSAYCLQTCPHSRLVLRSFAVFIGDDAIGGLLLKRFDRQPYRTPAARLQVVPHQERDLPLLAEVAFDDASWRALASDLIEQIVAYEAWVARRFGMGYVRDTLIARKKRPAAAAEETEDQWRRLAGMIQDRQ